MEKETIKKGFECKECGNLFLRYATKMKQRSDGTWCRLLICPKCKSTRIAIKEYTILEEVEDDVRVS